MKRPSLVISSIAGCLAMVGTTQAAVISFSFDNPTATTEINQSIGLGLFNSGLGTLTAASLELRGTSLMSLGVTNNAVQSQRASMTSTVLLLFSSSLAPLDALIAAPLSFSFSTGIQSVAVGETRIFGPSIQQASYTLDLSSILSSLSTPGLGNFDVSCSSLSGIAITGGGGNLSTTQSTSAGCGASVTYTYDTTPPTGVPEPGTLALLGVGLAGLGFASRRRRA